MKLITAILVGKFIAFLTKFLKIGGGSAAPGLYALKIEPKLIEKTIHKIPKNIIITGTNGKTTTSKMLAHFAKDAGLKIIRNHTGSNLERGIASTLLQNSSLHLEGVKLNYDLGIWEIDEAAFNAMAPKINPDLIVFLNVFRDQLDRYGEIDTIVKNWYQTLQNINPKTTVLINGDDENTAKLAKYFKGKVQNFGVKGYKIKGEAIKRSKPKKLDFEAADVHLNDLKGSSFLLQTTKYKIQTNLHLPGLYHIYDAIAAIALAHNLNFPLKKIIKSLKSFQPAFGRVEKLPFGHIFLIKNPAGATQVFETIAPNIKPQDRLLFALNDNLADGKDVSWIWDADFELIQNPSRARSRDYSIYVSGSRANDLAIRLKYAGFEPNAIVIEPNLKNALQKARIGLKGQLFILPTYTAMLELQSILAKLGIKKRYWENENL